MKILEKKRKTRGKELKDFLQKKRKNGKKNSKQKFAPNLDKSPLALLMRYSSSSRSSSNSFLASFNSSIFSGIPSFVFSSQIKGSSSKSL